MFHVKHRGRSVSAGARQTERAGERITSNCSETSSPRYIPCRAPVVYDMFHVKH
jgi:hypothetical protein